MASNEQIKSELSPQDLELISLLQWAPRITWGEAAEILDTHPTTLAGRWEKLRQSGVAWITAQVNLRDPRNLVSVMTVSCDPQEWDHVVESVVAMPEVLAAEALGHDAALGLTVLSQDFGSLSRIIEEDVSKIRGVTKIHNMITTKMHQSADTWRLNKLSDVQREAVQAWAHADRESVQPSTGPLTEDHLPVIKALMLDGRASAAEIARSTGLHPATARRHVHRVLSSGLLSIRCDLAQQYSAAPVTARWFARLDANRHEAAAEALARDPRTRIVSSITGGANFTVVMWLSSVAEILDAERTIQSVISEVVIRESVVALRPLKRMGWVLRENGYVGNRFVPPRLNLG